MASSKELKALITLAGKVDPSLQSALLKAQKGTADTTMKLSKLEQVGVKALNATRKAAKATAVGLAALAVSGGAALWQLGKEGIETASNLAEVQNVVDVTFADSAKEIDAWSSNLLNSYGLAELAAKKYASTIGAMLKSSGVADDDMRVMSKDLTQLAADMASFYNLDSDEAFNKIRSGISGETEPLKQLGINMSVANMQAFALSKGITKSYSAMSQAEQMTLRYQYLMSVTADAQGDFARTSDSFANQQKLLKENMSQLAATIMTGAVPALAAGAKNLNAMIASVDTETLGSFVTQIVNLAVGLMPIATDLLPVRASREAALSKLSVVVHQYTLSIAQVYCSLLFTTAKERFENINTDLNDLTDHAHYQIQELGQRRQHHSYKLGFSARPAIFGEAGLEAAIPIKRGNRRSISLLQRTAQLLGVSNQFYGGSFVYSPVINDGDPERLQPILRRHYEDMKRMWQEWQNRGRRLSFGGVYLHDLGRGYLGYDRAGFLRRRIPDCSADGAQSGFGAVRRISGRD